MTTTAIDPAVTLGELVVQRPARAELFERLRLDYCCGGATTLEEACRRRGLDPDTVRRVLDGFDADPVARPAGVHADAERRDWMRASLGDLCEHIVGVHHEGLRRDLPLIAELLDSVLRVHGPVHRELYALAPVFAGLRAELEGHLALEERELFPGCRALDDPEESGPAVDEALLAGHEHDHREVGDALAALRELTGDYDADHALCRTHRRLLEGLHALELDLHRHVHEENNILFPRVRALLTERAEPAEAEARDADLPPCCRTWIAEQSRPRRPRRP